VANGTEKRRSEMRSYVIRVDFEDETFEVVEVPADSIGEAVRIAERDPEVVSTTVLYSVGEPEEALAF
jgi:hypothetical protein